MMISQHNEQIDPTKNADHYTFYLIYWSTNFSVHQLQCPWHNVLCWMLYHYMQLFQRSSSVGQFLCPPSHTPVSSLFNLFTIFTHFHCIHLFLPAFTVFHMFLNMFTFFHLFLPILSNLSSFNRFSLILVILSAHVTRLNVSPMRALCYKCYYSP